MKRRNVILGGIGTGIGLLAGCTGVLPGGGTGGDALGDVPVPSGFEKEMTVPNPEEGLTIVRYSGSGSPEDAVAAFKSAATDAGWAEEGTVQVLDGKWSGVGFKKDGEFLMIQANGSDGEVTVTVIRADKELVGSEGTGDTTDTAEEGTDTAEETASEESPPQTDVDGSDIEGVPRYPGSVRTEYSRIESESEITIMPSYIAEATVEDVKEFYEETLPDNGWTIQQSIQTDDGGQIMASKDSKVVTIGWDSKSDYEGYIKYGMQLVKPK